VNARDDSHCTVFDFEKVIDRPLVNADYGQHPIAPDRRPRLSSKGVHSKVRPRPSRMGGWYSCGRYRYIDAVRQISYAISVFASCPEFGP